MAAGALLGALAGTNASMPAEAAEAAAGTSFNPSEAERVATGKIKASRAGVSLLAESDVSGML